MTNDQVASALSEIAVLMELLGENSFRVNAYHNASRAVAQLGGDIATLVKEGTLNGVAGIGATMQEKITTLVTQGKLPYLEELKGKVPAGLLEMLRVGGLGPKKVMALHKELGIDSLEKLKASCNQGEVAKLKGFGEKTQAKILEGIQFLSTVAGRVRLDEAQVTAAAFLQLLEKVPGMQKIEVCGSLRRRNETVRDIDILIAAKNPTPVMDAFVSAPGVMQVLGKGETKSSVLANIIGGETSRNIQVDLRVVSEKEFPFALAYFTGSKDHNVALRGRAQDQGMKLNEYALEKVGEKIDCTEEKDIYKALGLQWVPPEMRENSGEIALAEKDALPELVQPGDIRGVLHCHTTYSDGVDSLTEMVDAARKLGFDYFGIGDHSQSLKVANGLSPERVKEQHKELDHLQSSLGNFRVFKGIECDILADGSLDYDDEVLGWFDYVVASVHTHFQMAREEMTQRVLRAIRHPKVTILGHPTGRLVLRRDAYALDLEAVFKEAAKTGTAMEINAHPLRLDLNWVQAKYAKELGIPLVINPDAHSKGEVSLFTYGVSVARKAWLTAKDVLNTSKAKEMEKFFQDRTSWKR
ncbi:MAG: DNA polymerase/3'-5' exonuclease PolX [Gemmataceae bacterium]|nr:DNA polymerase/3'-5' exonuclease PolX [Gemmataceae bacterium]